MAILDQKSSIRRMIRLHRKWILENSEDVREYASKRILAGLADGSLQALRNISSNLGGLATYYGTRGVITLIDGDSRGWQQVHHSCLLHLWVLRIESALFDRLADSPSLTRFVPRMACALCYTIVSGLEDRRQALGSLLSRVTSDGAMATPSYWRERRFEPFVIRLNQLLDGVSTALRDSDSFGVYGDILSNWTNDSALVEALVRACDYHCANMDDGGADWDPEFDHPPFDLIPWELLAIQNVRQRSGLSMPQLAHPLAAAPMMLQVEVRHPVEDEFLPRIEQLFLEYFRGEQGV